jgi:hypothetical protein
MTNAVRVSEDLVREAKIFSRVDKRSITGQIEHWARIGKCAEEIRVTHNENNTIKFL